MTREKRKKILGISLSSRLMSTKRPKKRRLQGFAWEARKLWHHVCQDLSTVVLFLSRAPQPKQHHLRSCRSPEARGETKSLRNIKIRVLEASSTRNSSTRKLPSINNWCEFEMSLHSLSARIRESFYIVKASSFPSFIRLRKLCGWRNSLVYVYRTSDDFPLPLAPKYHVIVLQQPSPTPLHISAEISNGILYEKCVQSLYLYFAIFLCMACDKIDGRVICSVLHLSPPPPQLLSAFVCFRISSPSFFFGDETFA